MLAFPGMIAEAAKQVGMKVPNNPDGEWLSGEYPHFHVFCNVQLARPMRSPDEHWENAKVIVAVPENEIQTITLEQLLGRGLIFAN